MLSRFCIPIYGYVGFFAKGVELDTESTRTISEAFVDMESFNEAVAARWT